MVYIIFIIGLLADIAFHLTIPLCFVIRKKRYENTTLLLISLSSGLLGFIIHALMVEQFRGFAGILLSVIWTGIGYLILRLKCTKKTKNVTTSSQVALVVENTANPDTKHYSDAEIKEKIKNLYKD